MAKNGKKDMTHIQNKRSNEKIWLRQENGVYVLDLMEALRTSTMVEVLIRIFTGRDSVYDTCKPCGRSFQSDASMMCLRM